ncbi:hypothetical protein [Anaerocolumna jejuensis]|uniref:hypothetical protein n=1 Tax=Anaerocolumna jejuensis TaxID=259063 RepID=UPI003F7BEC46
MAEQIRVVMEYNQDGFLLYAENYCGAFTRGKSKEEAMSKFEIEIKQYLKWRTESKANLEEKYEPFLVQEKVSDLNICDADSDIIFETEKVPLTREEYENLKQLVIKSAKDFNELYHSIPNKNYSVLSARKTFYGSVPRTPVEMYVHTNNVTSYYVGEIGAQIENKEDILQNRIFALNEVERLPGYLDNKVIEGSYNEMWSLRKVLRRFLWHDRIHAKAMYRMAVKAFDKDTIKNPFYFDEK